MPSGGVKSGAGVSFSLQSAWSELMDGVLYGNWPIMSSKREKTTMPLSTSVYSMERIRWTSFSSGSRIEPPACAPGCKRMAATVAPKSP